MKKLERQQSSAELASIDALLGSLHPGNVLGRIGLTSRRKELERFMSAGEYMREARTALFFGGAPVIGSQGIEASFASEALRQYQDLLTKVWGLKQHGSIANSGPVPAREAARLHVTNVVHGSFGFELADMQDADVEASGVLPDAIESVTRALVAAGTSDDELTEVAEEMGPRAFHALTEFFAFLRRSHATFRVVSSDVDHDFDANEIQLAAERTAASTFDEKNVEIEGKFEAVLPDSRTYEFRADDGALMRGKVVEELSADELRTLNARFGNRECVATFHVMTITRGGKSRVTRALRRLDHKG